MTNTQINIGIRRHFKTLGGRNFETSGTVLYKAERKMNFLGTTYAKGASLPFDVGGTHYSKKALHVLAIGWNNLRVLPTV